MDIARWLAAVERDTAALVSAAERGPLDAPVPSCPGWSLADLVHHSGSVLAFWTAVVRDEIDDPETLAMPGRPSDADLVPWFRTNTSEALAILRTSDPAAPCWTWSDQHDIAFVIRRLAQEIAVHAWDASGAVGPPAPIDAELASDGVDEFLTHFATWRRPDADDLGGTVHLHCTDVAGEWLVVQDGTALTFTREHAKGTCALRGAAEDLVLALWRRRGLDAVDVIGDADVAARFVAWTSLS